MAHDRSAGYNYSESEQTTVVATNQEGDSATVILGTWGPSNKFVSLSDKDDIRDIFGDPTVITANSYYNAYKYLLYADNLKAIRPISSEGAFNASPIFDSVIYKISVAGSNFAVGDKVIIKQNNVIIEDTAIVSEIKDNGRVSKLFIPSHKIIERLKVLGTTSFDSSWLVEFSPDSSGIGANVSLEGIEKESGIAILNDDIKEKYIADENFNEKLREYGLPTIIGKYIGERGNALKVEVINYQDYLEDEPLTLMVYPTGEIKERVSVRSNRGTPSSPNHYIINIYLGNTSVESHVVSTERGDTDYNGFNIFIDDYFNSNRSKYIYASAEGWIEKSAIYKLGGGNSGNDNISPADVMKALDKYDYSDGFNSTTFFVGGVANMDRDFISAVYSHTQAISLSNRKKTVYIVDAPIDCVYGLDELDATDSLVRWRSGEDSSGFTLNSSQMYITTGAQKFYDPIRKIVIPLSYSGDIAGLVALRAIDLDNGGLSQSPAGPVFGVIRGHMGTYYSPNEPLRTKLVRKSLNPIYQEGGDLIVFDELTAMDVRSIFDKLNHRLVTNQIALDIEKFVKALFFGRNTVSVRNRIENSLNKYLNNKKGIIIKDGIAQCNEKNNNRESEVNGDLNIRVAIEHFNSIRQINLSVVATDNDVRITIEELGGI